MLLTELFSNTESSEKNEAIETLVARSSPRAHFFFMIGLSVAMATFGILTSSTVVVIASMLIAPMLYPVLSLSMGFVMGDVHLISRSSMTLGKAFVVAVVTSTLLSLVLHSTLFNANIFFDLYVNSEYLLYSIIIAFVAGLAGSYSLIKAELSESLPGVAIAVALVPPLAVMGVATSMLDIEIMRGAFLLFLLNIFGIVFAAAVVFSLFRLSSKRTVAVEAVKVDEKEVQKEKEAAAAKS